MAQNCEMTVNFSNGFNAAKTVNSGTTYAECLPQMRQNYLLTWILCLDLLPFFYH